MKKHKLVVINPDYGIYNEFKRCYIFDNEKDLETYFESKDCKIIGISIADNYLVINDGISSTGFDVLWVEVV